MYISWKSAIRWCVVIVITVLSIVGGMVVLDNHVDNKIDKKIHSQEYIHKLSSTLRPYLIFNYKGNFLVKHGAETLIDTLIISKDYINEKTAFRHIEIIIHPTQFLKYKPIIKPITPLSYKQTTERLGNISWKYNFDVSTIFNYEKEIEFQLELIN
jgi:hypothetical protein